uniref:G-protein coupled receptors family 1 profile domain-containing protein n=1 Tax=Glossina brevipalpis TaxID=37001 RepID=A0A1A9X5I9_9MUSC
MLTRLYTTEEDPALCSIIWGTNFTATPAADENDSNVGGITAASTSLNGASAGYISSGRNSAAAAIVASVTVGDNLRDDFYISNEDPRTEILRQYSYGIILPIICALGIIGNVLNLVVLTRRNMRGTAYIYMRGS